MISDILDNMRDFKGAYPAKVKGLMKIMRNSVTGDFPGFEYDLEEDPVVRYDYDSYYLKKRIEGTVAGIAEAKKRLSGILSATQLEAMFAFSNSLIMKGGYNHEIDRFNRVALSSAIWILDELLLAGNINEIYQYLPAVEEEDYGETRYLSVKHPIYDDDLIFSLVYLIRHRNTSKATGDKETGALVWEQETADSDEKSIEFRSAFDSIIALLNKKSVRGATQKLEEKIWDFYRVSFSAMAAVEKKEKRLIEELDDLQKQAVGNIADALKPNNVLLMPSARDNVFKDIISSGQDFERRQAEIRRLENEIAELEKITLTEFALPNDREKLVKSLKGIISTDLMEEIIAFHVEDPFETAFALLYLMDTNSKIPWLYFGSVSVGYTMCDQLPYDTRPTIPKKPVKLTNWNSALYEHRYKGYRFEDIPDASDEPVVREYGKNLSQVVFANTWSLIPRVVPEQADLTEYFDNFGELSEHEKEAYSLLSYVLTAGQLRTDSIHEYQAVQALEQILVESHEEENTTQINDDGNQLKAENDRLRAKNRELVERVSDMLAGRKSDSIQVQLLQHQIELQEKELSDLREAVYLLENNNCSEPPVEKKIQYPYVTSDKIVSFGGHDTWLKEMRRKLPNVKFIAPDSLPNIELIRNADAVWLQTNCLSHAVFFRIINIVRQNGIPLRYFSFAGTEKCAEQLVKSLD